MLSLVLGKMMLSRSHHGVGISMLGGRNWWIIQAVPKAVIDPAYV